VYYFRVDKIAVEKLPPPAKLNEYLKEIHHRDSVVILGLDNDKKVRSVVWGLGGICYVVWGLGGICYVVCWAWTTIRK
jgi:hypothetical protein